MFVIWILICLVAGALVGLLWGLIPFFVAKSQGKPNMGQWGMLFCIIGGAISGSILAIPVMIGFVIAALVSRYDLRPLHRQQDTVQRVYVQQPQKVVYQQSVAGMCLVGLAGPHRGQNYGIGPNGVLLGRDVDCTIRFAENAGGISRHHCALRWQQGALVLVDLGSTYGTFLGDGRQLPPNYPTSVAAGSRFYLGTPDYLFEIRAQ